MKALIILEHDNTTLKVANYHTLSAAKLLSQDIDVIIIGNQCQSVLAEAKKIPYINKILIADNEEYTNQLPENSAVLIQSLAQNYNYILTNATTFGKNLLPRVASLCDVAMIADVLEIVSPDTFVRPIYAGNALATIQSQDLLKILTIRGTAFPTIELSEEHNIAVEPVAQVFSNNLSKFVSQELTVSLRPELTSARIIISGGRGLKSAENFKRLEKLADHLGAALGASRAAVDAGFAPNDFQVGQTGKVVAPDLYIAFGISGAIQHLAGMKDSKVIVAINNDPDAPIFQIADYGVVTDLFQAITDLEKELGCST